MRILLLLLKLILHWTYFHCCPRKSFLVLQLLPAQRSPCGLSILGSQVPIQCPGMVCQTEEASILGPHTIPLAAREAGKSGERCRLHHNSGGGWFPEHRSGCTCWTTDPSNQCISYFWFIFVILKPGCTDESPEELWEQMRWQNTTKTNWIQISRGRAQASKHWFQALNTHWRGNHWLQRSLKAVTALLSLEFHSNKLSALFATFCTFYFLGNHISYIKTEQNPGIIILIFAFQPFQVSQEKTFLLILKIEKVVLYSPTAVCTPGGLPMYPELSDMRHVIPTM